MLSDTRTYDQLGTDDLVTALKAVAEPTRLRILVLLRNSELNVKDLTWILDQSQPRLSRHLKLLTEGGIIERFQEGSWVYFHISQRSLSGRLALNLLNHINDDDPVLARDKRRISDLKKKRETAAQSYFADHAADWDRLRSLHVAEGEVEAAMLELLGPGPFKNFVDLGTGTGRVLKLFSNAFETGLGIDVNNTMLSYARSKLSDPDKRHIQMRHADIYNLPLSKGSADAVIVHQVLHYLSDPSGALQEAARIVKPGGKLLVVDFAPHDLEFLREDHAHERLGFSKKSIEGWFRDAGIKPLAYKALKPAPNDDDKKLTVSIWLGTRQTEPATGATRSRSPSTQEETI